MAIGEVIREGHYGRYRIGLSTDTKPTANVAEGTEFYEQDTEVTYVYLSGTWSIKSNPRATVRNQVYNPDTLAWEAEQPISGKIDTLIVEATKRKVKVYSDASYDYFCFAAAGTALNTAAWRVARMDSDGSIMHADGNVNFDNLATDLATVAGLSYS